MIGLAQKCGVTTSTLKDLVAGKVSVSIAGQLGVTSTSLQEFIDGGTSIGLASRIGIMSSNLKELRDELGEEGAKGFLIGLLIASKGNYKK